MPRPFVCDLTVSARSPIRVRACERPRVIRVTANGPHSALFPARAPHTHTDFDPNRYSKKRFLINEARLGPAQPGPAFTLNALINQADELHRRYRRRHRRLLSNFRLSITTDKSRRDSELRESNSTHLISSIHPRRHDATRRDAMQLRTLFALTFALIVREQETKSAVLIIFTC